MFILSLYHCIGVRCGAFLGDLDSGKQKRVFGCDPFWQEGLCSSWYRFDLEINLREFCLSLEGSAQQEESRWKFQFSGWWLTPPFVMVPWQSANKLSSDWLGAPWHSVSVSALSIVSQTVSEKKTMMVPDFNIHYSSIQYIHYEVHNEW